MVRLATSPEFRIPKTYIVLVRSLAHAISPTTPTLEALHSLSSKGLRLPNNKTLQCHSARPLGCPTPGYCWVEIVLTTGKNREVASLWLSRSLSLSLPLSLSLSLSLSCSCSLAVCLLECGYCVCMWLDDDIQPLAWANGSLGGNFSVPGTPGKVSTVTVPPPTVWGHVSVLDFLTKPSTIGFGHLFWCRREQAMIPREVNIAVTLTSSNHAWMTCALQL